MLPPTDFHTATLLGNRILLIGNLGYERARKAGVTQVAELDLSTFAIRLRPTTGTPPGWLHSHSAVAGAEGNTITVRGGLIDLVDDDGPGFLENPDSWSLDLTTWAWSRLTSHPWERYELFCEKLRVMRVWDMRQLIWSVENGHWMDSSADEKSLRDLVPAEKWEEFQSRFGQTNAHAQKDAAQLYAKGFSPEVSVIRGLFRPNIPHTEVEETTAQEEEEEGSDYEENGPYDYDEEDWSRHDSQFEGTRIMVDGVTVRYCPKVESFTFTVEGQLPPPVVASLLSDLTGKLEFLLNQPVVVKPFPSPHSDKTRL